MSTTSALLQTAQAHLRARRLVEAEQICRQILQIDRRSADAIHILAVSFYFRGNHGEAIEWMRKAILIRPNFAGYYSVLGGMCVAAGQATDAARYHRRSAELEPANADYLSNAGLALLTVDETQEALDACRCALQIQPNHLFARNNLAMALQKIGELDEAINEFRKIISVEPNFLPALRNMFQAISNRGELEASLKLSRRAMELDPNDVGTNQLWLMSLLYLQNLSPQQAAEAHKQWGKRIADTIAARVGTTDRLAQRRASAEKIRIGYVSTDFRRHAAAYFIEPILANHSRTEFEIFCYHSSHFDDAVTERMRGYNHHWRILHGLSDRQAVELIRQDQLDILVDLNGHIPGSRLLIFAHRPAPIQITYLGYSATTGMRQIDYLVTDSILDQPGDEQLYSEKLIRLPGGFSTYLPSADMPEVSERPAAGPITFISMHPLVRLNDTVTELWARILLRIPESRLLIARDFLSEVAQQRLKDRFASLGVNANRLDLHRIDMAVGHLHHYAHVDISLDSFPWSGHTTACEALWMGCPVVTLYGASHAGRRVASVLNQLGLSELIAHSQDEYVEIAVKLAGDPDKRANWRNNLRQIMRSSPLMDAIGLTRNLEAVYKSVLADPIPG
jgi:protein O-GlcNAc transferase